jgi:hypothetical protein
MNNIITNYTTTEVAYKYYEYYLLSHSPSCKAYTYNNMWEYDDHKMDTHHMPHMILGWLAYSFKQVVVQLENKT